MLPEFLEQRVPDADVRVQGQGRATLSVVTYDAKGKVLQWMFAGRSVRRPCDWRHVRSRFIIPRNVAVIRPRLTGMGPATVWLDLPAEDSTEPFEGEQADPRTCSTTALFERFATEFRMAAPRS